MGQLIAGYDVGRFNIYRGFWEAASVIERFTIEKGNRYSDGEFVIELRREHAGLWSVIMQNSPNTIWGEIELVPNQSETLVKIFAKDRFDRIGALITQLASEIHDFVQSKELNYPPRSGGTETTQPEKRGSMPPIHIEKNDGIIQVAGGDITTGGDNVGRDKTTNNTEVNIADKPTTG